MKRGGSSNGKKEVAGPYRSQSSKPEIKKKATKSEHREVRPKSKKKSSAAPPAPTSAQIEEHRGKYDTSTKQGRKGKRKEKKQLREADNANVFQGRTKSDGSKRQDALQRRGKAVRKILAGKDSQELIGKTPNYLQSLKRTGELRDTVLSEFRKSQRKSEKVIAESNKKGNSVPPRAVKEAKALNSFSRSEVKRLEGRKILSLGEKGVLDKHTASNKASLKFSEGKKIRQRADVLTSEVPSLPKPKKIRTRKGKTEYLIDQDKIVMPKEYQRPKDSPRYKWVSKKELAFIGRFNKEQAAINAKVPDTGTILVEGALLGSMAIPGTGAVAALRGLGSAGAKAAAEATLGVERTAALAARGAAVKGAYVGAKEATGAAIKAAPGIKQTLAAGEKLAAKQTAKKEALLASIKAEDDKLTKNWLKDIGIRRQRGRNAKGQFQYTWVAGKSVAQLNKDMIVAGVPNAERYKVIALAKEKIAIQAEKAAADSRVIAGAGSANLDDLTTALLKESVEQMGYAAKFNVGKNAFSTQVRAHLYDKGPALALGGTTFNLVAGYDVFYNEGEFTKNAVRDAQDLVAGFVPSTAEFLVASGDALLYQLPFKDVGSPTRFQQMWKEFKKVSPVWLAVEGEWDKVEEAFEDRPVSSLLEVSGVYSAAGKSAGFVGRRLPPGFRFGETGGRESLQWWGGIQDRQRYSKNLLTKQLQKVGDKGNSLIIGNTPVPVKVVNGRAVYDKTRDTIKAEIQGARLHLRVQRESDSFYALQDIRNRANQAKVRHNTTKAVKIVNEDKNIPRSQKKIAAHAVYYQSLNIIRSKATAVDDLIKYRDNRLKPAIQRAEDEMYNRGHSTNDTIDQQKMNLEIIEQLIASPELLKSPATEKAFMTFRDQEDVRQKELVEQAAVDPVAAELAPWIPYVAHYMEKQTRIVKGKDGITRFQVRAGKNKKWRNLKLSDVEKHFKDETKLDPKKHRPAMVTTRHYDESNYPNLEYNGVPTVDKFNRTGKDITEGTANMQGGSLLDQAQLSRRVVDIRRSYTNFIDRMGLRVPGTSKVISHWDRNALLDEYKGIQKGTGLDVVPVNLKSLFNDQVDIGRGDRPGSPISTGVEELSKRIIKDTESKFKDKNDVFVLIPKVAYDRIKAQAMWENKVAKFFRRLNAEFKGSVLAFNPKWHLGNVVDMASRLYFDGAGIHSYMMGRKLLNAIKDLDKEMNIKRLGPNGAKQAELRIYNDVVSMIMGGHYAATQDMMGDILEKFDPEFATQNARMGTSLVRLGKSGVNELLKPWRYGQRQSFRFGSFVERHMKTASLGKEASRKADELGYKMWDSFKMTPGVIEDLAKGFLDTNTIESYAKTVNDIMGDYTSMSPALRLSVATATPFALWARAATKFVFLLPKNSPGRVALTTTVNRLNEEERAKLGLSRLHPDKLVDGVDQVFPYQRGAIPSSLFGLGDASKDIIRTNTYTSLGVLNDIDGYAGFILPWEISFLKAWEGKTWYGEDITLPSGKPLTTSQKLGLLGTTALTTFVQPIVSMRKLLADGDPSDAWYGWNISEFDKRKLEVNPYTKEVEKDDKGNIKRKPADSNKVLGILLPTVEESGAVKYANSQKEEKSSENSSEPGSWLLDDQPKKEPSKKEKKEKKNSDSSWLLE